MKILKIMLITLVLCIASIPLISCRSAPDTLEYQVVTVQRGDLTIDITAVGNLAFSHQEELTFEASGTVGEVLVEVGDSVKEGQVLAKLDDTSITSLQEAVAQAMVNLEDTEENLEKAENPSKLDVAQAEAAVANAKVALETAQEALETAENPYSESDIAHAELAVTDAEIALDEAQENLETAEDVYKRNPTVPGRAENLQQAQRRLTVAELDLAEAEDTLAEVTAGANPLEVDQKQKQLAVAQANLTEAEDDLAEMLGNVNSLEVELKRSEVASAQAALNEAIKRLEMATMVAPSAGIVISVNVEAGETVNANQVVIVLVDPNKFEAEILVNEMDTFNIQLGAEASIQVDAVGGISFPAKVTHISPTATIQSGVVNYKVKVELESLESLTPLEPPAPSEEPEQQTQTLPGSIDEALDKAVKEGLISQEQADLMKERFKQFSENLTPEQIEQFIERFGQGAGGFFEQQMGQRPMGMMLGAIQLREGLTVTVSVIIQERNDVLLVPNQAIIREGQATFVQVLKDEEDGAVIEQRPVIIGISDWQYTEVIEGLSEGEQMVVPQGTTAETTPQQETQGGMRIPGLGRMGQ